MLLSISMFGQSKKWTVECHACETVTVKKCSSCPEEIEYLKDGVTIGGYFMQYPFRYPETYADHKRKVIRVLDAKRNDKTFSYRYVSKITYPTFDSFWQAVVDCVDKCSNGGGTGTGTDDWNNLTNIPAGFSDNVDNIDDADNNPLNEIELPTGGVNGQLLSTDGAGNYTWVDDQNTDTNTQLTEVQVDAFVANNGYITSPNDADSDPLNEIDTFFIGATPVVDGSVVVFDTTATGLIVVLVDGNIADTIIQPESTVVCPIQDEVFTQDEFISGDSVIVLYQYDKSCVAQPIDTLSNSQYDWISTNTGNKGDYIEYSVSDNHELTFRIKQEHTPQSDILSDIQADNVQIIDEVLQSNGLFTLPATVAAVAPTDIPNIAHSGDKFITDVDNVKDFREAYKYTGSGKTYWVDINNGNNGNDGLSINTPFATIEQAKTQVDAKTIMVASGIYPRGSGFVTPSTGIAKNYIAYGGPVYLGSFDRGNVWTQTNPSVWQQTINNVIGLASAVTYDDNGVPLPYEEVSSVADVTITPKSYFYDGATLYVHSSENPDNLVYVPLLGSQNEIIYQFSGQADSVYMEGFHWVGGAQVRTNTDGSQFRCSNCSFSNQSRPNLNFGVLRINSISDVRLLNCTAAYSASDGYNYHDLTVANPVNPFALEINCRAYGVGIDQANGIGFDSHQPSSSHEDYIMIRVNGDYERSEDCGIADVGDSKSVILGSRIYGFDPNDNGRTLWFDRPGNIGTTGESWVINAVLGDQSANIETIDYPVWISGLPYEQINYTENVIDLIKIY